MPAFVLTDVQFLIAQYDFSAEMNEVALNLDIEIPDNTTFNNTGTRSYTPGLQGVGGVHHGWWDNNSSGLDPAFGEALSGGGEFFDNIGQLNIGVHTIVPDGGDAEDQVAYFFEAQESKYSPGGGIGELFGFDLEFMPRGDLLHGRTMLDGTLSRSATVTGSALQLGAPGAAPGNLTVYSSIHCLEFTGTSLDVTIESDDAMGFATPTTRITHTQLTDRGSEISTFTAGTTDDWWRVVGTFVGTSFTLACVVAIQA